MPKVSVIVPVYNVEKYLKACLDSLIGQTLRDIEIICVDDGSTDASGKILDEYAANDDRIKVIHQKNGGLSCARNSGLNVAIGDYVSFVDSDDWVDTGFLEKLYSAVQKHNADIAVASIIRKREHNEKFRVYYTGENCFETLAKKIAICNLPKCCYVWNKLYKKEIITDWQFKAGVYFEDVLWLPDVLKKSGKLVTVSDVNYYYRVNPGSTVKQRQSAKKIADRVESKRFIMRFFEENNLPLSRRDKTITKKIVYLGKIPLLKVKEFENKETSYLFGLLPVFKRSISVMRFTYNILGIKITRRKKKMSEAELAIKNYVYENGSGIVPHIKDSVATLRELLLTQKSIARYGDGEFNLIFGEDLPFQKYNSELAARLKYILNSNQDNTLIAIPDVFAGLDNYVTSTANFWRKVLVHSRAELYSLLNMDKQYYDSLISRPYIDLKEKDKSSFLFDEIRKLWNGKNIVIVEGTMSRLGVGNDLFDDCRTAKRIICPIKNAYSKYNEILNKCLQQERDSVFIIALGPTATVLAYDLSANGFRALDLGHIDIEYEWFLLKATKKVAVKNKYVNEVKKGRINSDLNNEKYLLEIVETIE